MKKRPINLFACFLAAAGLLALAAEAVAQGKGKAADGTPDANGKGKHTREVVEQLGMRRPFAKLAEIAGRPHQPFAEMMHPDPVGQHTGRERIRRRYD